MSLWNKLVKWFNEPVITPNAPYKIEGTVESPDAIDKALLDINALVKDTKDIDEAFQNAAFYTNTFRQLEDEEGFVGHAYQDHLGYWTIGIGRLIDERKNGSISREEALYLLKHDVDARVIQLDKKIPWWNDLDCARKSVLLQMSFQMGIPGLLKFKNTLNNIKAGNYEAAADSMSKSLWAKQTPQRAARMAEQMRSGKWQYIK
jgi:lysozyme